VGATRASGITKLMMSEAGNFPEITAFYQQEVILPGQALFRRIMQRGIDRGEFRPMDLDYAIYTVIAPMIFLILAKHSAGTCADPSLPGNATKYIATQVETILHGICVAPSTAKAKK
jgi:hypothetical protein